MREGRWKHGVVFVCAALLVQGLFGSATRAADLPPWFAEMPTVNAVRAAVKGRDPADTTAQFDATLQSLIDYLLLRGTGSFGGGFGPKSPPEMVALQREYLRARTPVKPARSTWGDWTMYLTPEARQYVFSESFRLAALAKFLPPASIQAFRNEHYYRPMLETYQNFAKGAADEREYEVQQAREKAALAASRQGAASDLQAAARDRVDMKVFDLRLGAPLNLRPCSGGDEIAFGQTSDGDLESGNVEPSGTEVCAPQGTVAQIRLAQARAIASDLHGGTLLMAQLPSSRCPDWVRAGAVRCEVQVVVKDGLLVAVGFATGGEKWQKTIESNLIAKYGDRKLDKSRVAQCKRRSLGLVTQELPLREWDLSSLHVRYNPLGSCATDNSSGSGWVQVELASYRQLSHQVREEQRAAEPKM